MDKKSVKIKFFLFTISYVSKKRDNALNNIY